MNNKDLIAQYVDTGLRIPEYQYTKLPNWGKKTYIRKRLIATKMGSISDDSGRNLDRYELMLLDKDVLPKYLKNRIDYGVNLQSFEFDLLTGDKLKHDYIYNLGEYGIGKMVESYSNTEQIIELILKIRGTKEHGNNIFSDIMRYSSDKDQTANKIIDVKGDKLNKHDIVGLIYYGINKSQIAERIAKLGKGINLLHSLGGLDSEDALHILDIVKQHKNVNK